jgi:hypothetical protein
MIRLHVVAVCLVALLAGCEKRPRSIVARLQHEDPGVRIEAIQQAARRDHRPAVPFLVDRLSDSQSDVRFFAAIALRRMTGRDFGYAYYERPGQRQEAIQRWRAWLRRRRGESSAAADDNLQEAG